MSREAVSHANRLERGRKRMTKEEAREEQAARRNQESRLARRKSKDKQTKTPKEENRSY